MSALSELLDTRGDELALLGWVVRYAPDGDEDAALRSEFREAMAAQVAGRHWTKEDERDRGQTFARLVGQVWALAEAWPHFVPKR